MIDIADQNTDLVLLDTQAPKAKNILNVQIGSLEYAQDLGIDLEYFLKDDLRFQNESFKAYLTQVLANRGVRVTELTETLNALYADYLFKIAPEENDTALIAR